MKRVLFVDDVPQIADFFRRALKRLEFLDVEVVTATSGKRALEILRDMRFDVVLTDYRLGDGDGIQVLSAARHANPDAVRILFTGYGEIPTPVQRLTLANVDAYLQKPFHESEVYELLLNILNGKTRMLNDHRAQARRIEREARAGSGAVAF